MVIELGAGIGLCSIVAGMFATCAVCTGEVSVCMGGGDTPESCFLCVRT